MSKKKDEKLNLAMGLLGLSEQGVKTIRVEYSGGGDSGDIDDVNYHDLDEKHVDIKMTSKMDKFEEALKEFCYTRLQDTDGDWINNEGGNGNFEFKVPSGDYQIHHSIMESVDYEYEGALSEEVKED